MSMKEISLKLRRKVMERAQNCCEYCQLSQQGQEATFHIDHVIPRALGGTTEFKNLAVACVSCSLRKSAKTLVVDHETSESVSIFNPRTMNWQDHFVWEGVRLRGLSATGRATISALQLNRSLIIAIREEELIRRRGAGDL